MTTLVVGPRNLRDYTLVAHVLDILREVMDVPVTEVYTLDDGTPNGVEQDAQRYATERGLPLDEFTSPHPRAVHKLARKTLVRVGGQCVLFLDGDPQEAIALKRFGKELEAGGVTVHTWLVERGHFLGQRVA